MNKPNLTNLARMQREEFKLEQMVKELERQRAYKQWLQALQNQLKEEEEREKRRTAFMAKLPPTTLPPTKSRARSRRARSNSMTRHKSKSNTRSNRCRSAGMQMFGHQQGIVPV